MAQTAGPLAPEARPLRQLAFSEFEQEYWRWRNRKLREFSKAEAPDLMAESENYPAERPRCLSPLTTDRIRELQRGYERSSWADRTTMRRT